MTAPAPSPALPESPQEAGDVDGAPPSKWAPWANLAMLACTVLGLALSFATMVWVDHALPSFSDGFRRLIGLVGLAGVAVYLVLRSGWRNRSGKPVLPHWWRRYGKWIAAVWITAAAAVILVRAVQEQADLKERYGYRTALTRISRSRELADRLGEPIQPSWWIGGGMEPMTKGTARGWRMEFSVFGPKGSAKVCTQATSSGHHQLSESIIVTIDETGERLELVRPGPARTQSD